MGENTIPALRAGMVFSPPFWDDFWIPEDPEEPRR
jgi:hypothetical protein